MKLLITGGSGFIGTNAIEVFAPAGMDILNYSLHPPLKPEHKQYWHEGDIMDSETTKAVFQKFQPERVLHLAARAECDENTTVEEGYKVNTQGTQNVLDAICVTPSVQRVIITSSQFVCRPGLLPTRSSGWLPRPSSTTSSAACVLCGWSNGPKGGTTALGRAPAGMWTRTCE